MNVLRRPLLLFAMLLTLGALAAFAACGGGDNGNNGDDNGSEPNTEATQPAGDADDGDGDNGDADDNGDGASGTLTLVAKNLVFDKTELTAPAGEVTIVMDNQDPGLPHDLAVFKGTDADGELMGKTEIEPGPVEQTLTLDLEAGEYFYVCQVHPTTMTGTLIVE